MLNSPIRGIDTADGYSERRIRVGIDLNGGLPADFTIFSKVDPSGKDYSAARVHASLEESLTRLGVDRFPLLYLHDPQWFPFDYITEPGGALDTLVELKQDGRVDKIGVARDQAQSGRPRDLTASLRSA